MEWNTPAIQNIALIPLWFLLLLLNIWNVRNHGAKREAGYICLFVVALVKIVGDILNICWYGGIAGDNTDVFVWGQNLTQLGFYPLLIAALAFIRKWIRTWEHADRGLDRYLGPVRSINVILFAAFVCNILGGAWSGPGNAKINTGYQLRRAGNILFLISNVVVIGVVFFMTKKSVCKPQRWDPILVQQFWALPIMLTRIAYATAQSFISTPTNPATQTWLYFILVMVLDLIATTIYTLYGILALRPSQRLRLEQANKTGIVVEPTENQKETYMMQDNLNAQSSVASDSPSNPYPQTGYGQNAYAPNTYGQNPYPPNGYTEEPVETGYRRRGLIRGMFS